MDAFCPVPGFVSGTLVRTAGACAAVGIPLYPPTVVYQQLIGEAKSRVNACKGYQAAHNEWIATLGDRGNNFTHKYWYNTCTYT